MISWFDAENIANAINRCAPKEHKFITPDDIMQLTPYFVQEPKVGRVAYFIYKENSIFIIARLCLWDGKTQAIQANQINW